MSNLKQKLLEQGFKPNPNWRGLNQMYQRENEVVYLDEARNRISEYYVLDKPVSEDITQPKENGDSFSISPNEVEENQGINFVGNK